MTTTTNNNNLNILCEDNVPCSKCDLICEREKLKCEKCHSFFHYKCSKLPKRKIIKLLENKKPYYCSSCYFPCPVCKKTTQDTTCMKCPLCENWYHLNCTKMTKKQARSVFRSNTHYYCIKCVNEVLPFSGEKDMDSEMSTKADTNLSEVKAIDFDKDVRNCEYLSCSDLPQTLNDEIDGLTVFHGNVRSFPKNKEKLEELFIGCNKLPDIIALTETKINTKTNMKMLQIPGYTFYKENSKTASGGVGVFVSNSIKPNERADLQIQIDDCENIWIEVKSKNVCLKKSNKPQIIVFGLIYRHPTFNFSDFKVALSRQLLKFSKNKTKYIIAGDFNIDLLEATQNHNIADFVHAIASTGCNFHINKPTRVSKTLIDHVYSNFDMQTVENKIIRSEISPNDHFSTLSTFHQCKIDKIRPKEIFVRKKNLSVRQLEQLNSELYLMLNSSKYTYINEVNSKANYIIECYKNLMEKYMPLRKLSKKERRFFFKPWINKDLQKEIYQREKLFKKRIEEGTEDAIKEHKQFKNKLSKKIFSAKKQYFQKKVHETEGDKYKMWGAISQISNGYKTNHLKNNSIKELIDKEGNAISSPKPMANLLNDYFNNIGNSLAKKLPLRGNPMNFMKKDIQNSIFLFNTSVEEVYKLINKLSIKKSSGPDGVTGYLLKVTQHVIVPVITDLFNKCLHDGVFPEVFKTAQIVPLFKEGDASSPNNYRPISLLSQIGKTFERILHDRLYKFLQKNKVLCLNQFGFRKNFSTLLAVSEIYDNLLDNLEKNLNSCVVFLDLRKAFDTVNHDILIRKMERYGIRGIALSLFKSYLCNRKHFVKLGNFVSDSKLLNIGVPQGSVLGPLLFLIYINDMPNATRLFVRLFADDTFLAFQHKNVRKLQKVVNQELDKVADWLLANQLSLNLLKSKYMLITRQKNIKKKKFKLNIKRKNLEQVSTYKYLGVYFDENLNWKSHIQYICQKVSKVCGILSKLRYYLDINLLKMIYYALVYPYLLYGVMSWGSASETVLNIVRSVQNRVVKVMRFIPFGSYDMKPVYEEMDILKIDNIYKLEVGKFMYKFDNDLLPDNFNEYFQYVRNVHTYSTRMSTNKCMYIKISNTKFSKKMLKVKGTEIWNSIPLELKELNSVKLFSQKLKSFYE